MPSDLLDDGLIKVARVSEEAAGNIVCMFDSIENTSRDRKLRAFAQLSSVNLGRGVCVFDPEMVGSSCVFSNVVLEDDDIRIRDRLGVC